MPFKVNKEKCVGCGVCAATCEGGYELGEDGKSQVINQEKAEECGKELCPYGAIEEVK